MNNSGTPPTTPTNTTTPTYRDIVETHINVHQVNSTPNGGLVLHIIICLLLAIVLPLKLLHIFA
ncbi:hypothetical protein BpHYR1_016458 [Brachionus plicatilis]|uniref:Uncharacterized protein n=1 Tax=Brachionus plicatilis TaxID=10195 RepID=A0A3M7RZN3_BRAPC|nr:hypothetical protein BpHYR1_016458 [Brachionus plicatilis]